MTQIEADVPIEPIPLQADATHLDLDLQVYERPLAVTPFGTPEVVPDWQDTHAMHAFLGDPCLGKWIRTDLGVRTFQGLGRNGPAREQVFRRVTRDLHSRHVLENLLCDSHLQVPLHRRCLPACGPTACLTRDIQTTFVYRLFPRFNGPDVPPPELRPSRFPSGGGVGSASLSKIDDTSVRSTIGTRTLSLTRQFIEDVEKGGEEESDTGNSELKDLKVKYMRRIQDTRSDHQCQVSGQEGPSTLNKEAIKALRQPFEDFENQLQFQNECDDSTSDEEGEPPQEMAVNSVALLPNDEEDCEPLPAKDPQLYLCDDWIQPMAAMSKPRELTAREKMKANMAKNCLIVTLMSLELGYGSILERYQQESQSIVERYQQARSVSKPVLNSVFLTDEELVARRNEHLEVDSQSQVANAAMPPPTRLSLLGSELAIHSVRMEGVKNTSLKMYHVMSVKQTWREDLAEHAYQFSCRAADWSRSDFSSVPMRFEPLELHVVNALGQQEVPDYFQQPAKPITEDVSGMRGPDALEWILAVREEIESFKRLGVYEEVPQGRATSTPLPARLILVTKPNVHGGPANKKARIVICGNFQELHPDEFTASKTPSLL